MKLNYLLIVLLGTLTSCATILTQKSYYVNMYSNVNDSKVRIADSTYSLPTKIKIERSKSDLNIQLTADSISKNFKVESSLDPLFSYGNLLWMGFSPAAYLIDLTNQKRFYYGKSIYLDIHNKTGIIPKSGSEFRHDHLINKYPEKKGQINLAFSLPYINSFHLQPQNETPKTNTGFGGISIGLEYFYKANRFLSINAYAASDFFLPVPAAVDIYGEFQMMSSAYLSLTDNYKIGRLSFGYGLSYSRNIWELRYIWKLRNNDDEDTESTVGAENQNRSINWIHT